MYKLLKLAVVFASLIIPSVTLAAQDSSKTILDNGMTVVIHEMPSSPVVSVYGLVKTGSATEGKFLGAGLSHFLEHMLFKSTQKRKVGEIAALIQSVGGEINASTGKDYTIYTITVPAKEFDVGLDVLSDMLMNAVFDEQEFERERRVILGEMRLNNDNPDRRLSDWTFQEVFLRHPYRHPTIGYESVFKDLTTKDVEEYYKMFYVPNNMIISVAGKVDTAIVLPKIKKTFEGFKREREITVYKEPEPSQITSRYFEEEYPTDVSRLSLSFLSVSVVDEDLFALDVLAKLLGQGASSRLYQNIYKKGLAYEIGSSNYTPMDPGIFNISSTLEQKNFDFVLKAIWKEIENIKTKEVSAQELNKARNQVLSEYIMGHQTASSVAYAQAIDEAYTGDYEFSKKYVDGINNVKAQDVKRVANIYLKPERSTLVLIKPPEKAAADQKQVESLLEPEIEKIQFPNGLTLLLREDHSYPIINIRAVSQAGLRQEDKSVNGISQLTSAAWVKGTKKFTSKTLAEYTETLGMAVGTFSGKNSFGLNVTGLSKDQDKALEIFEEVLKNPTFPENEIAIIKDDMKAVIRQRNDNIFEFTSHHLKERLFPGHPLSWEEEGTPESIDRISQKDIKGFYQKFVSPANLVISIFGDIDPKEMKAWAQKNIANWSQKTVDLKKPEVKPISGQERIDHVLDKEQAMVVFGFQGPSLYNQDRYAVEIVSAILGSSFSGRLFTHVREKLGQAYTVGGSYAPSLDAGLIFFYVLTTNENTDKVIELVKNEINLLRTEIVGDDEIKSVKTYLKGNFEEGLETNSSLGLVTSLDELYGLGFGNYKRYKDSIDAVTAQDIKNMADKYLDLNKAVIAVTRSSKADLQKQQELDAAK